MRRVAFALCVGLLTVSCLGFTQAAQTTTSSFQGKSWFEFGQDSAGWQRKTVNYRFDFFDYQVRGKAPLRLLFSQQIENQTREGQEGRMGKISVEVFSGENYAQKLWSLTENANDGRPEGAFYRSTLEGCCDAETTQRYFSLSNGRHVMSSTSELLEVEVPNTSLTRWIAYLSARATLAYPEKEKYPDCIGVLTLVSDQQRLRQIVIRSRDPEYPAYTPKIALLSEEKPEESQKITLWWANQKESPGSISRFKIKIELYGGKIMLIPVDKDDFNLKQATIPAGFSISRISFKQDKR